MRLLGLVAVVGWFGATLLLADVRWFSRARLADRLSPYRPRRSGTGRRVGAFSVASLRDVLGPVCNEVGASCSRWLGVPDSLSDRLHRLHSPMDATAFRLRQVGWSVLGFAASAILVMVLRPPAVVGLAMPLVTPLLVFVAIEQQLQSLCTNRRRRVAAELPVVAEQLGMLLTSGWSLTPALRRLAGRGSGAVAQDLARVCSRIGHGLSERDGLAEWADVDGSEHVARFVAVLARNRETNDLGRLISEEARVIRAQSHREVMALLERRAQMVWIPVTVAALVPGVIFLSIPFIQVMQVFST